MRISRFFITLVLIFGLVVFHFFLYIDRDNGCFIKILPSLTEFSNINIKRSLKVLKNATPKQYQTVCENVSTISPNFGCGGIGGGCYYQGEPETIYISTTMSDLVGSAAIIVHETCHVIQGKESRPFDEQECYQADELIFNQLTVYE